MSWQAVVFPALVVVCLQECHGDPYALKASVSVGVEDGSHEGCTTQWMKVLTILTMHSLVFTLFYMGLYR